ncbi:bifunctional metallophosphatase/5'-nucleotidase, partial [Dermacoccus sp. NHGro5]|nr:bifunctional metallophosphatase/5'-nucleotidase [Dermacoccus sp. NHGro5]
TTPTTEPTTPTTEPTTPPAGSTSSTTGATETGSASDGASPTTTTGPKVDTDGVSNERAVTGLAGLAVVVVAAGAGIAMRLRRQS